MDDTAERIRHIIAEVLFMDDDDVKDDSKLEDLGTDNEGLWFDIEEGIDDEFNVVISEEDAEQFVTVGDVVKFVRTAVEGYWR